MSGVTVERTPEVLDQIVQELFCEGVFSFNKGNRDEAKDFYSAMVDLAEEALSLTPLSSPPSLERRRRWLRVAYGYSGAQDYENVLRVTNAYFAEEKEYLPETTQS